MPHLHNATASLTLLSFLAGCGSEGTACGPGTEEVDGVCVADESTGGPATSSGPSSEDDTTSSGATTQEPTTTEPATTTASDEGSTAGDDDAVDDSTTEPEVPETCEDGVLNQDELDVDCGGVCEACPPCFPDAKRVFVTSRGYEADFTGPTAAETGLEGGDAICQLHADNANLGGTWVAWLSDADSDAIDRIPDVGPWYLPDQCQRVFESKAAITFDGPERPIDTDEAGDAVHPAESVVWTGTNEFGRFDGFSCSGWTSSSGFGGEGTMGDPQDLWDHQEHWTAWVTNPCNIENRILCLEQ